MPAAVLTPEEAIEIRDEIGKDKLIDLYRRMLRIRRFEERTVAGARQKKIAGFLHSYIGTEPVATGIYDHLDVLDENGFDYTVTSYRCHAQALLSGEPASELMAELYGKVTGNVRGKGGSMHFFSAKHRMLGGHGIVGGQTPVGTGGAFACKYRKNSGVRVTFMGDGASAQGTLHECLNIASLWDLPGIYIVENNQWGMGTAACRAVSVDLIAESKAPGYNVKGYTIDGTDLLASWKNFQHIVKETRDTSRPVLVEAKCERFMGHSGSDSQPYRTRDDIQALRDSRDGLSKCAAVLIDAGWASQDDLSDIDGEIRQEMNDACAFADDSPEPPMSDLMTHVLAEETQI